jgi:hypothetical protein
MWEIASHQLVSTHALMPTRAGLFIHYQIRASSHQGESKDPPREESESKSPPSEEKAPKQAGANDSPMGPSSFTNIR